jgi:hypothetical protein
MLCLHPFRIGLLEFGFSLLVCVFSYSSGNVISCWYFYLKLYLIKKKGRSISTVLPYGNIDYCRNATGATGSVIEDWRCGAALVRARHGRYAGRDAMLRWVRKRCRRLAGRAPFPAVVD